MNPFTLLNQPESIQLDLSYLEDQHRDLSAKHHPDAGGDEALFKEVNKAYQTLKPINSRALALLEINNIQYNARGTVSNDVMEHFTPLSELFQQTDKHLKQLEEAASQLQKALLTGISLDLQSKLEQWIQTLDTHLETIETQILSLSIETDNIQISIRDTAFLLKWKAQLRERYAQLFI